jgi:type II secretory pathway pseudopilin PulG
VVATILFVQSRSGSVRAERALAAGFRGVALVELAIALFLFSLLVVSVGPLFLSSSISNEAANESARANALARNRLEQLLSIDFRAPALSAGFHGNDLPAKLPDPQTGRFPSSVSNPFERTWRVEQFAIPDDGSVPPGALFTPSRVRAAGVRYDYKRIDVTVQAVRRRPALGQLAVRVSAIRSNPDPDRILSEGDGDP